MPPGQQDTAAIHFLGGLARLLKNGSYSAINQSAAAGRAPVPRDLGRYHHVTMGAKSLHRSTAYRIGAAGLGEVQAARASPACDVGFIPGLYTGVMDPPVRLVAIDMDGTLLPTFAQEVSPRNALALKAAQEAGITVAIATGRRTAYTAPLLEGLGLRADMPLITSNGAVTRMLDGTPVDSCHLQARVARGLCGLLRPFGALVFTFDRLGGGEMVLEDMEKVEGRIAIWVEANRSAIQVVKPLEDALADGENPIQGMVAGVLSRMREAENALKASDWGTDCECIRTEYPARNLSILDLLPAGVSKGWALERLAARLGVDRKETMAIGDNWNDVDMLEWAGQGVMMGNAAAELRTMAKMRGWKQAPRNDEDGVAVILEAAVARACAART